MKVILFGATGMVGQGLLRECLLDPTIEAVLTVGRSITGQRHVKLREIAQKDLFDLSPIESDLSGYEACFFCLGTSSSGMSEADYRHITYDLAVSVGTTLARLNPSLTFIFVSGTGTDSTEKGRVMWARVKGAAENALLKMPFKGAYMFRPGFIQPMHGITSRTALYRIFYVVLAPLFPLWKWLAPRLVTTTEELARVMIFVAKNGSTKSILESGDIVSIAQRGSAT